MNAKTDFLEQADTAFAEALAEALDIRERETGLHSYRVACHTLVLARRFTTNPDQLRQIYWGALLHDIGKIGISDAVLLKQGPLDEEEWKEMRTHPEKGYRIVILAAETLHRCPRFDERAVNAEVFAAGQSLATRLFQHLGKQLVHDLGVEQAIAVLGEHRRHPDLLID